MLKALFSENKIRIFIAGAVILAGVNIYCYRAHFEEHLKLRDYSASEQLLYNPSFAEEGYAPDALIREVVRGRRVIVPRELRPYNEYPSYGHMHEEGNPFSSEYFWENNYTKYFTEYASEVIVDTSLPDLYELDESPLPQEIRDEFVLLGPGNDMMRYVFLADHTDEEVANQFYYTWYYTVESYHPVEEELQIRICPQSVQDDDELVALWDKGENLFLMGKTYYEEKISGKYTGDTDSGQTAEEGR